MFLDRDALRAIVNPSSGGSLRRASGQRDVTTFR